MSNYSSLKATINANVKQNGNQEITGAIMNSVLNAMVDSLGAGYQYKGVATPATNPGTPDYNVFYLASGAGTYTNFGGLVIGDNEVAALVYNGSWSKQTTGAATASEVSQLAQKIDEFAQGKFYGYFEDEGELPAGDIPGFAYVGMEPPFAIYNYDGDTWTDSGLTVNGVPVGNGEDIDFNADGLLQFANRAYDAQDPNGMGYVILRKDRTFAEQVTQANTIYEIRYSFDLNGASVTIPAGCVLMFKGGFVSHGTLVGNETSIIYDGVDIFSTNVILSGSYSCDINPIMFGVLSAQSNDIFNILKITHTNANSINAKVSYSGVGYLKIVIPSDATPIKLKKSVDFGGCTIEIENTEKNVFLFEYINENPSVQVSLTGADIDSMDLSGKGLPDSPVILSIQDDKIWCQRYGSQQVYSRKDVSVCVGQKMLSPTIYPYNTADSIPACSYKDLSLDEFRFWNLSIIRNSACTYSTYLLKVLERANIYIENINVKTDNANGLTQDSLFNINSCVNVNFSNILIDGTYSTPSTYGYAFELTNLSIVNVDNLCGRAAWHIFGTQSINGIVIRNSNIDTFDCHAYCKNVTILDSSLLWGLQLSYGIFGIVTIERCRMSLKPAYGILYGGYACPYKCIVKDSEIRMESNSSMIIYLSLTDDPTRRTDVEWATAPSLELNGTMFKTNGNTELKYYATDSQNRIFTNTPEYRIEHIMSDAYLSIVFASSTATLGFGRKIDLVVCNSDLSNIIIKRPNTSNTEDKHINSLTYRNCTIDCKATSFTSELAKMYFYVLFDNCRVVNMYLFNVRASGYKNFSNCYISFDESGAVVRMCFGIYTNCQLANIKSLYFHSATEEGYVFENCTLVGGGSIYEHANFVQSTYTFKTLDNGGFLIPNPLQTIQTLYVNDKAFGFDGGKMVMWGGSSWVNMDGTPLS